MSLFAEMYAVQMAEDRYLCVGLDPDRKKIPMDCVKGKTESSRVAHYMEGVVEGTTPSAGAFKPQIAFFEALGSKGHKTLRDVIRIVRDVAPGRGVLLDFKRGDIGNTNAGYVELAYDYFGADGVTVHPYLGMEAMRPFLVQEGKLTIVLVRTSNSGAAELQDVPCRPIRDPRSGKFFANAKEAKREGVRDPFERRTMPFYQFAAARVAQSWNEVGDCAVVVGATWAKELELVRSIVGDLPILVPGLGSQGGKLEDVIPGALNSVGWGIIPNNASAINFAFEKIKHSRKPEALKYKPKQYIKAAAEAAFLSNKGLVDRLAA